MYRPNELQVLKYNGKWYTESSKEQEEAPGILSNAYEAIKERIPSVFGKTKEVAVEKVIGAAENGQEKPAPEQEDPNLQPPYCYPPISGQGFTRIAPCTFTEIIYSRRWDGHGWRVETVKPLEYLADEAFVVCTDSGKEVVYKVPIKSELAERLGK